MEFATPAREAEVSGAMAEKSSVPVPRLAAPSRNVTVPVGMPAGELTVAVKVTGWPKTLGFAEEIDATVVGPLFTICDNTDELLGLKFDPPTSDPDFERPPTSS